MLDLAVAANAHTRRMLEVHEAQVAYRNTVKRSRAAGHGLRQKQAVVQILLHRRHGSFWYMRIINCLLNTYVEGEVGTREI